MNLKHCPVYKKEGQCGNIFLNVSKEATIYKAKPLTYPYINGKPMKESLEILDSSQAQVTPDDELLNNT